MAHCQLFITFTCRLRLSLIIYFEFKVRLYLIHLIVYIEGVKYII